MIRTAQQIQSLLSGEVNAEGNRCDTNKSISPFTLLRDVIDSLGTIVIGLGGDRVYKRIWVPFNALKAPGTKPAIFKEWGISGVWEFSDGTDDTVVFNILLPGDMDRSVAPVISVGWSTNTAVTTETAVWQLEYLYNKLGGDTTAAAQGTLTVDSNADAQADGLILASFPVMDIVDADDICVHCRLKRLGADGNDDLTDTAELHGTCLEYVFDKLGESI